MDTSPPHPTPVVQQFSSCLREATENEESQRLATSNLITSSVSLPSSGALAVSMSDVNTNSVELTPETVPVSDATLSSKSLPSSVIEMKSSSGATSKSFNSLEDGMELTSNMADLQTSTSPLVTERVSTSDNALLSASIHSELGSSSEVLASSLTDTVSASGETFEVSLPLPSLSTEAVSVSPSAGNVKQDETVSETAGKEGINIATETGSSVKEVIDGESNESNFVDNEESAIPSSSKEDLDTTCKILTKYVYINKPVKPKTNKKKLRVLYKQAFRHFQGLGDKPRSYWEKYMKLLKKNQDSGDGEEESIKDRKRKGSKGRPKNIKKAKMKERKVVSSAKAKGSKGSEVRKVALRKNTSRVRKAKSASRKQNIEPIQSRQEKTKGSKYRGMKCLSLSEKVDIIRQLESASSFVSVAKNFNINKTTLASIVKQKDKILKQQEAAPTRKRKSRPKKLGKQNNVTKLPIIKIERCDEDVYENDIAFDHSNTEDIKVFPIYDMSNPADENIGAMRNRRELTLHEKVELIRELEKSGQKLTQLAQKFGISTSAVSRIRKHKDRILSKSLSGDVCQHMRRTRDCKDPVLDKALLKWYRAIEAVSDEPISITNPLLQDKGKDIAMAMGRTYFPTVNWIIRWKYRHDIKCKSGRIETKERLDELDIQVNMTDIIMAVEGQLLDPELLPEGAEYTENGGIRFNRPEKHFVCEHCGIMTTRHKDSRKNNHLKTCPLAAKMHRHDLTLGEKAQVVRALERPGTKMVFLAKKYGVSSSAISRIHKNRVDILARCAGSYVNPTRKRDRVSSEPEVERALCDWYRQQLEYGFHVSSNMVREKAHEIAAIMGKDFSPSESWVFRWRHRNNVNGIFGIDEMELDEEGCEELAEDETESKDNDAAVLEDEDGTQKKKKKRRKRKRTSEGNEGEEEEKLKIRIPRSVMCEKCGCVSTRLKNNRIRNMRHSKGCPDMKPRNELTYEARVQLLKDLEEPGATLTNVARRYGISTSSTSRMRKKKDSIMHRGMDYGGHKRIRECKEPEVAKLLFDFFLEKQREGIHPTGKKLKEKAAALAQEMGREFKASTGWLGRWKHRYNIVLQGPKHDRKSGNSSKYIPKRRNSKKKANPILKEEEEAVEMTDNNFQNNGNASSIITIMPDESQPLQAPRMFLSPRYQNPWAVNHQPSSSCARSKDFASGSNHTVPEESHVPYPYDHVQRHMFHNMFENFATAASYPVSMVEPSAPIRDYMPPDEPEAQPSTSHHHHPPNPHHHHHHPIISHQPPPLNLHQQNHVPLHQQQVVHHSSHSPVDSINEEDNVHQQQIMEACKLMNSFAKEKSLGEHVQAALRTIEMSLKGNERKGHPRTTYTNM